MLLLPCWGWNSSVGNGFGSQSCVMRRGRLDSPESPVEGIFPLEPTCVLTPFPDSKTLSDESINQGLVCAHMHSIAQTQKILTFMS